MIDARPTVLTVTQLNNYVKRLLDGDYSLNCVFMVGEISNFNNHYRTGHMYFTLKDENSAIKAVMFKSNAQRLRFMPEDGMSVIVRGRVSLFEAAGAYQIYIDDMQPDGVGALALQFEQLKRKLAEEGLFDASHKKSLPPFPEKVGIITSPTGAAVQDIKNILSRRFPCAEAILYPVSVQGENSENQLVKAVNYFSNTGSVDVVIIGRGGGSIEDLWSFNSLIKVFEKMRDEINGSILIISHQERILNIADKIIVIAGGQVDSIGTKEEILPRLMSQPGTCKTLTDKA